MKKATPEELLKLKEALPPLKKPSLGVRGKKEVGRSVNLEDLQAEVDMAKEKHRKQQVILSGSLRQKKKGKSK